MTKKALFATAWTLARQAAARLGGTARAHFGACLKAAWATARTTKETAVTAVTPAPAPVVEVPDFTAENTLRAVLGPRDAMDRYYKAHRTPARELILGSLSGHNAAQERDRHLLTVAQRAQFVGFAHRVIARAFRVHVSTMQHVVDQENVVAVEVGVDGENYEATKADVLAAMRKLKAAA